MAIFENAMQKDFVQENVHLVSLAL